MCDLRKQCNKQKGCGEGSATHGSLLTYQFLLLHALHEDDEQMLGLCSSVREGLLDGHQQLVPQRFIDKSAIKTSAQTGECSSYSVNIAERHYRT